MAIISCLSANAISREQLKEYASSLSGLKKAELKTAVYQIIVPQTIYEYGNGENKSWYGFYSTDRVEETNECINRYSARKYYFPKTNTGAALSMMNIEHSFAKSWWGGNKVTAYHDLYNLCPSDSEVNKTKSNRPMKTIENVTVEEEGYVKFGTSTINGEVQNCWEPGDEYKGDFARIYMYMATAYQDLTWVDVGLQQLENNEWPTLQEWAYTLYLTWTRNDFIDELEITRNNAVSEIQGNRNLFVDFPNLAEYIWGDSTNVAFYPETSVTTAEDDSRYTAAPEVAKPVFSLDGGAYGNARTVSISCPTADATIFYTTDGSSPITDGIAYSDPINVSENMTLKAVAANDEGTLSYLAVANYKIYSITDNFSETFSECSGTGGNDGIFGGKGTASSSDKYKSDNDGWMIYSFFGGNECARFGNMNGAGEVTTPTFNVHGESTFSFMAAPWYIDGTSLTLTVNNQDGGNVTLSETSLTMKEGQWDTYELTLTGTGNITITFTPTLRLFLDEVCSTPVSILGDVNKDGVISIADVTALVNIILGKVSADSDEYDMNAADVNQDGVKTIADVTALVNMILNK